MPETSGDSAGVNHPGSAKANDNSVSLVKNAPGAASRPALVRKNSRSSVQYINQVGLAAGSKFNIQQSLGEEGLNGGSIQEFGEQQLYENTYKMKPDKKFSGGILQKTLESLLEQNLSSAVYSPELVSEMTKKLSSQTIQEVTKIGYPRYKFVAEVIIGEMKGQGIKTASRCLWDTKTDSYVSAFYKNVGDPAL